MGSIYLQPMFRKARQKFPQECMNCSRSVFNGFREPPILKLYHLERFSRSSTLAIATSSWSCSDWIQAVFWFIHFTVDSNLCSMCSMREPKPTRSAFISDVICATTLVSPDTSISENLVKRDVTQSGSRTLAASIGGLGYVAGSESTPGPP